MVRLIKRLRFRDQPFVAVDQILRDIQRPSIIRKHVEFLRRHRTQGEHSHELARLHGGID